MIIESHQRMKVMDLVLKRMGKIFFSFLYYTFSADVFLVRVDFVLVPENLPHCGYYGSEGSENHLVKWNGSRAIGWDTTVQPNFLCLSGLGLRGFMNQGANV